MRPSAEPAAEMITYLPAGAGGRAGAGIPGRQSGAAGGCQGLHAVRASMCWPADRGDVGCRQQGRLQGAGSMQASELMRWTLTRADRQVGVGYRGGTTVRTSTCRSRGLELGATGGQSWGLVGKGEWRPTVRQGTSSYCKCTSLRPNP